MLSLRRKPQICITYCRLALPKMLQHPRLCFLYGMGSKKTSGILAIPTSAKVEVTVYTGLVHVKSNIVKTNKHAAKHRFSYNTQRYLSNPTCTGREIWCQNRQCVRLHRSKRLKAESNGNEKIHWRTQ